MILKKSWLSHFGVLELYGQVSKKKYAQKEPPTQIETQNTENQITIVPSTT